jgi:hypothetical protein
MCWNSTTGADRLRCGAGRGRPQSERESDEERAARVIRLAERRRQSIGKAEKQAAEQNSANAK